MKRREVYRSDTLLVRRIPAADRSRWVVTFDNHSIGEGFDRPGFGQEFLAREGVSAICILGRGNDWYQYPDMLAACAAARASIRPRVRVMTYGSSMGGYAALRFADALRAQAVLALSPQYSIDPAVVPWEFRWGQDADRIAFLPELAGPLRCACKPLVLFDPSGFDGRHADLIARDVAGAFVPLPHASHPVTAFLGEIGLLGGIVLDHAAGTLDVSGLRARIRARRGGSAIYLGALASAQPAVRVGTAIALGRRAQAANRGAREGAHALAAALGRAGRHAEALAIHEERVETGGRDVLDLIPQAEALLAAGERVRAVAVAREVVALEPARANLRHWLAWILDQSGALDEAIAQEKLAATMSPGSALYRDTLAAFERRSHPAARVLTSLHRRWRRRTLKPSRG